MKVGQLRAELSKRGLDVAGVRQVLMQRSIENGARKCEGK
jgi:hypothetical protein